MTIATKFSVPDLRYILRDGERILQQKHGIIYTDDTQGYEWLDVPLHTETVAVAADNAPEAA